MLYKNVGGKFKKKVENYGRSHFSHNVYYTRKYSHLICKVIKCLLTIVGVKSIIGGKKVQVSIRYFIAVTYISILGRNLGFLGNICLMIRHEAHENYILRQTNMNL